MDISNDILTMKSFNQDLIQEIDSLDLLVDILDPNNSIESQHLENVISRLNKIIFDLKYN